MGPFLNVVEKPPTGGFSFSGERKMQTCSVRFLPSRYGWGYKASLHSLGDNLKEWPEQYSHLRGYAVIPTKENAASDEWRSFVVSNLTAQGVEFLDKDEIPAYMQQAGDRWLHIHATPSGLFRRIVHFFRGARFWF